VLTTQVTVQRRSFRLKAKVGPGIHAKLYSTPWRYLESTLDARETGSVVQSFHDGTLVKTRPRLDRGIQRHRVPSDCARRSPVTCGYAVAVADRVG
jgi:hypothetical protein